MHCSYAEKLTVKTNMEKNPTRNKAMTEVKKKEGNTMHIETAVQKSEMAFHQGWQKQGINSVSPGL